MNGTEGIPQREDGIILLSRLYLMNLMVHPEVTAVYVCKYRRCNHGMVHTGIEDGPMVIQGCLHINGSQFLVPGFMSRLPYLIKIPVRNFGFHIGLCTCRVYRRQTNFYQHLFIGLGTVKTEQGLHLRQELSSLVQCSRIRHQRMGRERFRELHIEINRLVECPVDGPLMALNGRIVQDFNHHIPVYLTLETIIQIEDKTGFGTFREGITMNSGTSSRGQFRLYLITVQKYGIISRHSHFLFV